MSQAQQSPSLPSLLEAGIQAELIPVEDMPDEFWAAEEQPADCSGPRYTAERFFRKRPEDYRRAVQLLAGGMGLLKIASLLKVHHLTVAAVRDREGAAIDIDKQSIRRNLRLACVIGSERLPEVMANLAPAQLPVAQAILLDKLALLDGEPTSRTEHVVRGHLTHEAIAADLEAFTVDADLIGSDETGAAQNGPALLPASSDAAPGSSSPAVVDPAPVDQAQRVAS